MNINRNKILVCFRIFSCKIHYAEESKQTDGIVVRRGGAETLVLQ